MLAHAMARFASGASRARLRFLLDDWTWNLVRMRLNFVQVIGGRCREVSQTVRFATCGWQFVKLILTPRWETCGQASDKQHPNLGLANQCDAIMKRVEHDTTGRNESERTTLRIGIVDSTKTLSISHAEQSVQPLHLPAELFFHQLVTTPGYMLYRCCFVPLVLPPLFGINAACGTSGPHRLA